MTRSNSYSKIDFTPPAAVAKAAGRGLELRQEHGRGGTAVGVARARDLKAQTGLAPATIRRMVSYFARHEVDKQGRGWASRSQPSAGYIAWLLWGGNAGKRWAESIERKMDKADSSAKNKSTSGGKSSKKTATKAVQKSGARKVAKKSAPESTKKTTKKAARKTAKASTKKAAKKAPWKRPSPTKKSAKKSLTSAQKRQAKARAKKAGRSYPNLVDNMAVTQKS